MHSILQQINAWFQQISAWFPAVPSSMLIFFSVVAGFIAFVIVILILRTILAIIAALFGLNGRRHGELASPEWDRLARLNALRQQHHWEHREY